jgi:peroxiredoxin
MTVKVGDVIQDFVLKDQKENDVTLAELKGKKVLLSFHPLAWTKVCADQMKSLEKNRDEFEKLNTVALGFSVDSIPCKAAWAKDLGIEHTSLLADFWPHGGVADSLGIFRSKNGFSERANVIIDEQGKVLFVKIYPIPELPDIEEILNFLRG